MPYYLTKKYWDKLNKYFQIFLTFNLACVGWLIFRSEGLVHFYDLFLSIFSSWNLDDPNNLIYLKQFFALAILLFFHEIVEEKKNERYAILYAPKYLQYILYTFAIILMILFGQFAERKFIYFQF